MSRRRLGSGQATRVGAHFAPRGRGGGLGDRGKTSRNVVGRAHAAERGLDEERRPRPSARRKRLRSAASIFSCTMSRASRALSDCRPPGASMFWVRAAMVSAASAPACVLALAMARDRLARRRETIRPPPVDTPAVRPGNESLPGRVTWGKFGAAASPGGRRPFGRRRCATRARGGAIDGPNRLDKRAPKGLLLPAPVDLVGQRSQR